MACLLRAVRSLGEGGFRHSIRGISTTNNVDRRRRADDIKTHEEAKRAHALRARVNAEEEKRRASAQTRKELREARNRVTSMARPDEDCPAEYKIHRTGLTVLASTIAEAGIGFPVVRITELFTMLTC